MAKEISYKAKIGSVNLNEFIKKENGQTKIKSESEHGLDGKTIPKKRTIKID